MQRRFYHDSNLRLLVWMGSDPIQTGRYRSPADQGYSSLIDGELCWIKAYIARGIVESHGLCEGEREGYTNVLVGGGGEGEGGCLLIRWLLTSCACAACGKKREVWRWERWWVGRMTRRKIRQTGSLGKETDVVTVNLPRHTQSM